MSGAIYLFMIANTDLYLINNYDTAYSALGQSKHDNLTLSKTQAIEAVINSTCTIARFFSMISLTASVMISLVMAIDRTICVCYPKRKNRITFKVAHIMMLSCWLFGFVMTLTYSTRFLMLPNGNSKQLGHILQNLCYIGHHTDLVLKVIIWTVIGILLIMFLAIILLYSIIFLRGPPIYQHLRRRQYEMQIVWLTSCMMLIQLLSWIPGLIALISDLLSLAFVRAALWQDTSPIMMIFFYLSPAIHPTIYIIFAKLYSQKLTNFLQCCCCVLITKTVINKAESIRSNNSTTITVIESRRTVASYHG
ncbi:uncharacterized protein TRIADDRAFT_58809 [Trichoplax adhaerens]|uniref:G-protein coupled receptors family 1 profile domain-containing protein n=1 Tax=Trichoplax adhaerens TaxID=10228 RepID=B3S3Q6_TRIAD|nr:hypothetical protein TRIADDRAFT_58809 [Trichoplax adhaerens]EDV22511.1 hypothetical protein TRIADDRAFT_58809 [Trichoplax adhaerens]|eukprot:XP_002115055.1 hypothetical protein TRIADDRAFT_58809 [Trichoplax adhaerens]